MKIKKGSLWREDDLRFIRFVRVVGDCHTDPEKVIIESLETGRLTKASKKRFGKRGGYILAQEADK